jgi:hypothetical protein
MAPAIERLRRMRIGIVAVSGIKTWIKMKMTRVTANVVKSPIILGADQEYVDPPHWRARIRQTMDGIKNKSPRGSRRLNCSRAETLSRGFSSRWRNSRRAMITDAPMGRLM